MGSSLRHGSQSHPPNESVADQEMQCVLMSNGHYIPYELQAGRKRDAERSMITAMSQAVGAKGPREARDPAAEERENTRTMTTTDGTIRELMGTNAMEWTAEAIVIHGTPRLFLHTIMKKVQLLQVQVWCFSSSFSSDHWHCT